MTSITTINQNRAHPPLTGDENRGRVLSAHYIGYLEARKDYTGMVTLAQNLSQSAYRDGVDGNDVKLAPRLLAALGESPHQEHKRAVVDTALGVAKEVRSLRFFDNALSTPEETRTIDSLVTLAQHHYRPQGGKEGLENQRQVLAELSQNHEYIQGRVPSSERSAICRMLDKAQQRVSMELLEFELAKTALLSPPLPPATPEAPRPNNATRRAAFHLVQ